MRQGWTMQDWLRLTEEFIAVLDSIDYRPKNKDVKLKNTNIKNSQYVVSLHFDSKSGIPHLHIVANRIDNMGNTNDAHYIGERAAHAANILNEKYGWVQSMQRREENIKQISDPGKKIRISPPLAPPFHNSSTPSAIASLRS